MAIKKTVTIILVLLLIVSALIYFFIPFQELSVITGTPEEVQVCEFDTGVKCSTVNDCWRKLKDVATTEEYDDWQDSVDFVCNGVCIAGDKTC